LKRKMVEYRGGRTFLDVESDDWPVHVLVLARCGGRKPRGANTAPEITSIEAK